MIQFLSKVQRILKILNIVKLILSTICIKALTKMQLGLFL